MDEIKSSNLKIAFSTYYQIQWTKRNQKLIKLLDLVNEFS